MQRDIKTLLVANRGEIAIRIFRTAKKLGIKTVAIYDPEEINPLYVQKADIAFPIEGGFLNQEEIIALAQKAHVDAIHPGYGFLSEKADFAQKVTEAGIIFVGPSPEAIASMGDKANARELAQKTGVNVLPGEKVLGHEAISPQELEEKAKKVGFPLLLKSAHGGGGKGMRIVNEKERLFLEFENLRHEAKRLFHNADIVLEKYLPRARHVEVQIVGNALKQNFAIGDRDCSIQRFNQKIIEEAPAYDIPENVRKAMHEQAESLANEIQYSNAGTVEFLYDPAGEKFYFLEMNTRLQVEHPVTELTSKLDLVEEQLKIAMGFLTSYNKISQGHAIEARVCAEYPDGSFRPTSGTVLIYEEPEGVRVDSGIACQSVVLTKYDNLLSKVVVSSDSREGAIRQLNRALQNYIIAPIQTNIPLLIAILQSDVFVKKQVYTRYLADGFSYPEPPAVPFEVAAALYYHKEKERSKNKFGQLSNFSILGELQ